MKPMTNENVVYKVHLLYIQLLNVCVCVCVCVSFNLKIAE
jgi:hypothetical protein